MVYRQTERSRRVRETARTKILRAAEKLFAKRGFDATTMQEVVKAAGTSIGNLYFYFPNKGELLYSLLESAARKAWERADEMMARTPGGPPRLALMTYANALLVVDRAAFRVLMEAESQPAVRDRLFELNLQRLRAAIRANLPDYPESQIELAATAWAGAGRNCAGRWALGQLDSEPARVAEFVVRWNLRGLGVPAEETEAAIAAAEWAFGVDAKGTTRPRTRTA